MHAKPRTGKAIREPKAAMTLEEFTTDELPVVADVVTFCNNLPMSLYSDSTVVKTPEAVFRGLVLSQNRLLAEEYLLNFRRAEADLGVVIGVNNYRMPMAVGAVAHRDLEESDADLIPLPPYQNAREPLSAVIRSRRSIRQYSGKALSLSELSTLLFHGTGVTGRLEVANVPETVSLGENTSVDLRSTASGGGLYPIDLFVVALKVDQLPRAVYRYLPGQHSLAPAARPALPIPEVRDLAQFGDVQVDQAALLIGYVYNAWENARKYGEAGLAFGLMETGAIAAHIHLLCTSLGIGSCDVGSFSKGRFERLFSADGISRHMIHLTVVGK